MAHLIHRQTFELKFSSRQQAQAFSPQLCELNQQQILPELERLFTELAGERTLRLERLEIDLGCLRETEFPTEGLERLRRQVTEALQEQLSLPAAEGQPVAASRAESRGDPERKLETLDADSLYELLETFLSSGRLPWWSDRQTAKKLNPLLRKLCREQPERARALLKKVLVDPRQLRRLVEQFSNRTLAVVLSTMDAGELLEPLLSLRKIIRRLLQRSRRQIAAEPSSWLLLFRALAENPAARSELSRLVETVVLQSAQLAGLVVTQRLKELLIAQPQPLAGRLREEIDALQQRSDSSVAALLSHEPPSLAQLQATSAEPLDSGCEVSIENAGLVLLWPHLRQLFHQLDLLESLDGQRQRPKPEAVLLLQQLVSGHPAGAEASLSLNKLLCGLPAAAPIPRRLPRSVIMDQEVDSLLTTVVQQWSALKNSSIDGFRRSFLQREGLLIEAEQGCLLRIERKAYDVLLEQLPWGIAMIQLSWMDKPLQVEW